MTDKKVIEKYIMIYHSNLERMRKCIMILMNGYKEITSLFMDVTKGADELLKTKAHVKTLVEQEGGMKLIKIIHPIIVKAEDVYIKEMELLKKENEEFLELMNG